MLEYPNYYTIGKKKISAVLFNYFRMLNGHNRTNIYFFGIKNGVDPTKK